MAIRIIESKTMGRPSNPVGLGNTFGHWLRSAREARGLTQEDLGDLANSKAGVVSFLEHGKRNPTREMVERLANALTQPDADAHTRAALLDEGLLAAGFAPVGMERYTRTDNEIEYSESPWADQVNKHLVEIGFDGVDVEVSDEQAAQIAKQLKDWADLQRFRKQLGEG